MRSRIVVAGSMAQRPWKGGHTWVFLQYVLGFKRLGFDVLFLDRLDDEMCVDRRGRPTSPADSTNLNYLTRVMDHFGLRDQWAVALNGGSEYAGKTRRAVRGFVRSADLLLNIMGFFDDEEILAAAQRRVFLDIDPGYPQLWSELGLADPFGGHDDFVTIGQNVGQEGCDIPHRGRVWITTTQPIALDHWPREPWDGGAFTTVATWRGDLGPLEHQGRRLGLRCDEFRKFLPLPSQTGLTFTVALDIHPDEKADLAGLREHGWTLVDPSRVAGDPWQYRGFIRESGAELMVAKELHVATRGGWFSDRSICYLATGRPVLAQNTGFGAHLPTGEGLLSFSTLDQAVAGVDSLATDPQRHARAAREIAQSYFNSDIVLRQLLDRLASQTNPESAEPALSGGVV